MGMGYYIISGLVMLISRGVSSMLQRKFRQFSALPIGLSGAEVAKQMLDAHGISDVQITAVGGQLTDHYNPANKTVNLSQVVHGERNIAAAAVAAHEVGHAIQHAKSYSMLQLRSKLVPAVNVSSKILPMVMMVGFGISAFSGSSTILLIACGLFAVTTLFSLVTLPVEFDASNRALKWIESAQIADSELQGKAKKALFWAAMTYTVAAIGSIGQLLYYFMMYQKARRGSHRY